VIDVARAAVKIAREGLVRRGKISRQGVDESVFLAPVEETLARGETPAEAMLQRFNGEWGGDIDRVFADYAY
jgi:glutamate--cysteine ligase